MLLKTLFAGLLLFCLQSAYADTFKGYVTHITDGDTLTLVDVQKRQHKIRIDGIDAPERVQPFGSESQSNLGRLTFQKSATAECRKRDKEGLMRCKISVDGRDIGLQQIADGLAWSLQKDGHAQSSEDRAIYIQAETMAKLRRSGLWSQTNPTPPWNWKKLTR